MKYKLKETKQNYSYYVGSVKLDEEVLNFNFRVRTENAKNTKFVYAWAKSAALDIITKSMLVEED